jgi:hypothetical protein
MNQARRSHAASILTNGKVLVSGGFNSGAQNSAELYDPLTGMWTITDSMNDTRGEHTMCVLMDGKILIAGGLSGRNFLDTHFASFSPSPSFLQINKRQLSLRDNDVLHYNSFYFLNSISQQSKTFSCL